MARASEAEESAPGLLRQARGGCTARNVDTLNISMNGAGSSSAGPSSSELHLSNEEMAALYDIDSPTAAGNLGFEPPRKSGRRSARRRRRRKWRPRRRRSRRRRPPSRRRRLQPLLLHRRQRAAARSQPAQDLARRLAAVVAVQIQIGRQEGGVAAERAVRGHGE